MVKILLWLTCNLTPSFHISHILHTYIFKHRNPTNVIWRVLFPIPELVLGELTTTLNRKSRF